MAAIKKLKSGVSVPKEAGNSKCNAPSMLGYDQEGRVDMDCGPGYYEEGKASQSRYTGKLAKGTY